jgi:hypothetical protein
MPAIKIRSAASSPFAERDMRLGAAVAASVVSAAAPSVATASRRLARDAAAVDQIANGREYDGDSARWLQQRTFVFSFSLTGFMAARPPRRREG